MGTSERQGGTLHSARMHSNRNRRGRPLSKLMRPLSVCVSPRNFRLSFRRFRLRETEGEGGGEERESVSWEGSSEPFDLSRDDGCTIA